MFTFTLKSNVMYVKVMIVKYLKILGAIFNQDPDSANIWIFYRIRVFERHYLGCFQMQAVWKRCGTDTIFLLVE